MLTHNEKNCYEICLPLCYQNYIECLTNELLNFDNIDQSSEQTKPIC